MARAKTPAVNTAWVPRDLPYGELDLASRKRVACISRRHGVNLFAGLLWDDWLDALPEFVAAQLIQ